MSSVDVPVTPSATVEPGEMRTVRYSWYDPRLGGPNCLTFVNGECVSKMASGLPWQKYIDKSPGAVACPPEWPMWTQVRFGGQLWYCLDRGGKVKYVQGVPFLDFLVTEPHMAYNTIIDVEVTWP